MHDQIFAAPIARLGDFCFDEQVVDVFPDMIQRSVPGYSNIISAIGMMAARYAQPQSRLYDLGCSLGAATQAMRRHVTQPGCQITAVDLSHPMIERARAHLSGFKSEVPVELIEAALGLGVAGGHHADGGDDVAVTGHRALDHVGEDVDDLLVKAEVSQTGDRGGKNLIVHADAT
jgi:SAM-dependent methyltransferase